MCRRQRGGKVFSEIEDVRKMSWHSCILKFFLALMTSKGSCKAISSQIANMLLLPLYAHLWILYNFSTDMLKSIWEKQLHRYSCFSLDAANSYKSQYRQWQHLKQCQRGHEKLQNPNSQIRGFILKTKAKSYHGVEPYTYIFRGLRSKLLETYIFP